MKRADHETKRQVTSYKLQVTSYKAQGTSPAGLQCESALTKFGPKTTFNPNLQALEFNMLSLRIDSHLSAILIGRRHEHNFLGGKTFPGVCR